MKQILPMILVLCGAASLFAQGTAPPPIDEPPAELPDEPPDEDDAPSNPERKKSLEDSKSKRAEPKELKVRVRPKPKPPAKGRGQRLNIDVEGVRIADVMEQIGQKVGVSIITAPDVEEEVMVNLRDIPWREAVDVIAKMCRCEISEPWPGVLLLDQPAEITTVLEAAPLRVACEQIGETAGLDVVIGPGASGTVSLDLKRVAGIKALQLAVRSAGASIEIEDGVALITKAPLPPLAKAGAPSPEASGPYVDLVVEEGYLDDVVLKLAKEGGLKLIPDPGQSDPITLSLQGVDWRSAVDVLAFSAGAEVEELAGGILRLVRAPKLHQPLSLIEVDLREALRQLAAAAELSVVVDRSLSARVSVSVAGSPAAAFYGLVRASALQIEEDSAGVLWVGPKSEAASVAPASSAIKPAGKLLDVSFRRVELADAMEQLGQQLGRNILVSPEIVAHLSCHLTQVDWRLALDAIAVSLGCSVEDRGSGILLFTQAPPNRVVAKAAPVGPLLRTLAKAAGVNLVLTPGVKGTVDLDLRKVHWIEALDVAAELAGCKLTEGEDDVVVVVRDRDLAPAALSPDDESHWREVARLVKLVEEAALGGDLQALARNSEALRGVVERAQPKPRIPAPVPDDPRARRRLMADLGMLRDKIEAATRRRDVERISRLFGSLRGHLVDSLSVEVAREVFKKPFRGGSGDILLSIRLQIQIAEGNLLLKSMARAISGERYDAAILEFESVKELKDAMLLEERDVFHRNAQALFIRGRELSKHAERLREIEERFAGLRVQATLTQGFGGDESFEDLALVNGQALQAGEGEGKLPIVVEIKPGRVEFRHSGTKFSRHLR